MKLKAILACALITTTVSYASSEADTGANDNDRSLGAQIETTLNAFATHGTEGTFVDTGLPVINQAVLGTPQTVVGIHTDQLETLNLKQLKIAIAAHLSTATKPVSPKNMMQLVGDSAAFGAAGTLRAREFVREHFETANIVEYGFTGRLRGPECLDVNSFANEYLYEKPDQASRFIGNIVGHTVPALKTWGCHVYTQLPLLIAVYNDAGAEKGFTTFGADIIASDNILSAEDGDRMVVLEGGMQSFFQICNVLKNNIPTYLLGGLRDPERKPPTEGKIGYFSATEFLFQIYDLLTENPSATAADVRTRLDAYMKDREGWDPTREDAVTKAALFEQGVSSLLESETFRKVATLCHFEFLSVT